jgi:hypothetical protein
MGKTIAFMGDTGSFSRNYVIAVNKLKSDSVVLLGDNFYPIGINKNHLINFNKLWSTNPYVNKYMILGNHEYSGPPVKLYLNSHYWTMPDYCYMVQYEHCDIIMIDTMQLEPNWGLPEEHITTYMNGPGVVTRDLVARSTGVDTFKEIHNYQLEHIKNCLSHNPKKPKIVCGHYHIESPGYYDTNKKLKSILMPLFKKYNVKAYVCGHEHLSEHRTIETKDYILQHFIAGGLETRPLFKPCNKTKFCSVESAYLECTFTPKNCIFRFLRPNRETIYTFSITI